MIEFHRMRKNEKTGKWEMKPGMPSGHVLNATTTMARTPVYETGTRGVVPA